MRTRFNLSEFLASLDSADEVNFRKKWSKTFFLVGVVEIVSDDLLVAAFGAMDRWAAQSIDEWSNEFEHAVRSVFHVINQAIHERPLERNDLVLRLAMYCPSKNAIVSVVAIRAFEFELLKDFKEIAMPFLKRAAMASSSAPTNIASTVRAIAFKVLHELESAVVGTADLHQAQIDCSHLFLQWSKSEAESQNATELSRRGNALLSGAGITCEVT